MNRVAVGVLMVALAACSEPRADPEEPRPSPSATRMEDVQRDSELRNELVAMMEEDQAERTGGGMIADGARVARLKEIIEEHGWPTYDLVGRRGADAAWLIAQHADLDPEFQRAALVLLREAAATGQASPGNLAYLEDRVAVADGQPQAYGTQVQCTAAGPVPRTPIRARAGLAERRAEAGLPPYASYLREMSALCSG